MQEWERKGINSKMIEGVFSGISHDFFFFFLF